MTLDSNGGYHLSRVLLRSLLSLSPEVGGGGTAGEMTSEDGLEERREDKLGAASLGKSHPQDEDKLKEIVEWEPVSSANSTLDDGEESEHNPVGQPLGIVNSSTGKERLDGVVSGDDKSGSVDKEFSGNIEKHEEEVDTNNSEEGVDFGDGGLTLEVVKNGVFGELLINLSNLMLGTVLERHLDGSGSLSLAMKQKID